MPRKGDRASPTAAAKHPHRPTHTEPSLARRTGPPTPGRNKRDPRDGRDDPEGARDLGGITLGGDGRSWPWVGKRNPERTPRPRKPLRKGAAPCLRVRRSHGRRAGNHRAARNRTQGSRQQTTASAPFCLSHSLPARGRWPAGLKAWSSWRDCLALQPPSRPQPSEPPPAPNVHFSGERGQLQLRDREPFLQG